MQLSRKGALFVIRREALVTVAYPDGEPWEDGPEAGQPRMSIYCGHQSRAVKPGDHGTIADAFATFEEDIEPRVDHLNKIIKVDVTQQIFDALFSLTYQSGNRYTMFDPRFKGPFVVETLNRAGSVVASALLPACDENKAGVKLGGLHKRRLLEQKIWRDGDYGDLSTIPVWTSAPHGRPADDVYVVTGGEFADLPR